MEQTFSTEESFEIISKMIHQAKNEYRDKGDGWLLWGWLLFAASLSSAIFEQIGHGNYIPWIWNGMGIIVLLYLLYCLVFKKRAGNVKTYIEELLNKIGIGLLISIVVTIVATSFKGDGFSFGYFFILYAFWMFIKGSAIRFTPLMVGAAVNWAAAIAIFFVKDFKYVMLISALAIAIGYLVPGYMLRSQYKKYNNS